MNDPRLAMTNDPGWTLDEPAFHLADACPNPGCGAVMGPASAAWSKASYCCAFCGRRWICWWDARSVRSWKRLHVRSEVLQQPLRVRHA